MNANKIKRVLKWLRPSVQARLRKEFPELPERARSYKLTYEDLLLIDELQADVPPPKPDVPPVPKPKEEPIAKKEVDTVVRGTLEWMASQMPLDPPPTAQVIPFKKKRD